MKTKILLLLIISIILYSCGGAPPPTDEASGFNTDEITVEDNQSVDTTQILNKGNNISVDSLQNFNEETIYFLKIRTVCDKIMIEGDDYEIGTYIYDFNDEEKVLEKISNKINDVEEKSETDNIELKRKYVVSISFDDKYFKLNSGKKIDTSYYKGKPKYHEWSITPLQPGKNKKIIIRVNNIDNENHICNEIPEKVIKICVKVNNRNFFTKMWMYIKNNPEMSIPSIFIPLFSALFYYFKRRKKKK